MDPTESHFAWADGSKVRIAPLKETGLDMSSAASVGHDRTISFHAFDSRGRQIVTADTTGATRVWSLERDTPELTHSFDGWGGTVAMAWFNHSGSMLAGVGGLLWDLDAPSETEPLQLRSPMELLYGIAFAPDDRWLVTSAQPQVSFWPLTHSYPRVLKSDEGFIKRLAFTPDGKHIVSESSDGSIRLWPLDEGTGERSRLLFRGEGGGDAPRGMAVAPDGTFLAFGTELGHVYILPFDGGQIRELRGTAAMGMRLAIGPRSRLVAVRTIGNPFRIWDLESEEVRTLDVREGERSKEIVFSDNGDLWTATTSKIQHWCVLGDETKILEEFDVEKAGLTAPMICDFDLERRRILFWEDFRIRILDLESMESRDLSQYGSVDWCGFDSPHEIVFTADEAGTIRVGPATGEQPHLLIGHPGRITSMAVSPDGRWIASGADDETIRLWPMPDLSKPPLHTLPREELIAKLKTLTNLRVVRDEASSTGWKLEVGPFPMWETVPSW
jgi:WD40 repeat protein